MTESLNNFHAIIIILFLSYMYQSIVAATKIIVLSLLPECNPAAIERANLLIVCKLVIKEVIGSSLKHGRMLDDEHAPLRQFFIVLEHVLRHRIKRTCPCRSVKCIQSDLRFTTSRGGCKLETACLYLYTVYPI